MKFKKALLVTGLMFAQVNAIAGSVSGPYVVWVNLSRDAAPVDLAIRTYVNSEHIPCWERSSSLLFMRNKPAAITKDLVTRALLKREPKAINRLSVILKKPFGKEAIDGFDGIMAYTDDPAPRMYRMSIDKRRVDSSKVDPTKETESIETRFCELLPPINRQP